MEVKIPKYIKIKDRVGIMTFERISKINNYMYLYENVKTGCKQCFDIRDFIKRRNRKKYKTKYEE